MLVCEQGSMWATCIDMYAHRGVLFAFDFPGQQGAGNACDRLQSCGSVSEFRRREKNRGAHAHGLCMYMYFPFTNATAKPSTR